MSEPENTCGICECPQCAARNEARDNAVRLALLDELMSRYTALFPGLDIRPWSKFADVFSDLRKKYETK